MHPCDKIREKARCREKINDKCSFDQLKPEVCHVRRINCQSCPIAGLWMHCCVSRSQRCCEHAYNFCFSFFFFLDSTEKVTLRLKVKIEWMSDILFLFIISFKSMETAFALLHKTTHTLFFFLSLLVKTFIGWPLYMLHPNLNLHFTLKWTLLNRVNLYIAANNISLVCLLKAVSASWNNWLIKNSVGSINEDIIYLHS